MITTIFKTQIIKDFRQKMFMTQQELADTLNVTIQTVNRWENGESVPSLKNLKKIYEIIEKGNTKNGKQ